MPKEPGEVYRTEMSPDQRFKRVVYRTAKNNALPGPSGNASGLVRLYDQRTKKILQQKNVERVQRIDSFEWTATHLHIKLFADWPLPEDSNVPEAEPALGRTCIQVGPLACNAAPSLATQRHRLQRSAIQSAAKRLCPSKAMRAGPGH